MTSTVGRNDIGLVGAGYGGDEGRVGGATHGVVGGEKGSEKSHGDRGSPDETLDNLLWEWVVTGAHTHACTHTHTHTHTHSHLPS